MNGTGGRGAGESLPSALRPSSFPPDTRPIIDPRRPTMALTPQARETCTRLFGS